MDKRKRSVAARWLVSAMAMLFCLQAHADTALDLSPYRGRVVYLDFWASWCAPCRHSFPWMDHVRETYGPQGLTILAVNVDASRADAERFLQRFSPGFRILFDPDGSLAARYDVQGMPTSFMIDRHGAVRFTHVGFQAGDEARIEQELRTLLSEG